MIDAAAIERARATPIESVLAERGLLARAAANSSGLAHAAAARIASRSQLANKPGFAANANPTGSQAT